ILVLDEPFVGVDISAQKDFYAFLKELNEKHGLTILFVSHDIDVITDEVKSIICLNRGILCLDSPAKLHEPNVIETLYGKRITHIHHDRS
ncbi:MAG TPA: zinc ABC transporter ATP-binding protein, partial [Patescibacteria group bacterium]|nr:zinc ABC transporter ATP-binding protein [Patescibacteria group bacterium]